MSKGKSRYRKKLHSIVYDELGNVIHQRLASSVNWVFCLQTAWIPFFFPVALPVPDVSETSKPSKTASVIRQKIKSCMKVVDAL